MFLSSFLVDLSYFFCFFPILMWSFVLLFSFSVWVMRFPFLCLIFLFGLSCAVDRILEMFLHVSSLIKEIFSMTYLFIEFFVMVNFQFWAFHDVVSSFLRLPSSASFTLYSLDLMIVSSWVLLTFLVVYFFFISLVLLLLHSLIFSLFLCVHCSLLWFVKRKCS